MFHPNTIFIGKKSNWFPNIEENVSIFHNGTVILSSHLELCALMDKRNHHPSTLKKFSCKSFWRVMLPSHYLTALHPDLPPPTFSSGINTTFSALFPHRAHSLADDHFHLCLQLMLLPPALAPAQTCTHLSQQQHPTCVLGNKGIPGTGFHPFSHSTLTAWHCQ